MSNEEWVRPAARGDRQALERLVDQHLGRVYAAACALSGSRDQAQDLTQETFVEALRSLPRYRPERRFAPWLLTILRRVAARQRRRLRPSTGLEAAADVLVTQEHGAKRMEQMEAEEVLRRELAALPERLRLPLVLYYYDGKSTADVARCLGLRPATARKSIQVARDRLREGSLQKIAHALPAVVPGPILRDQVLSQLEHLSGPTVAGTTSLLKTPVLVGAFAAVAVATIWIGSILGGDLRTADGENAEEDVAELDAPVEGSTPRSTRARDGEADLASVEALARTAFAVIRGTAQSTGTQSPLEGISVQLIDQRGQQPSPVHRATTGTDGAFVLYPPSPGRFAVEALGSRDVPVVSDPIEIVVARDEDATLDLWVERAYFVSGSVVDGRGQAMIGLGLEVIAEGTGVAQRLNTDSQGRFRTPEPLAAGSVGLSATTQVSGMLPWGLRSLPLSEVLAGTDDVAHLELVFPWNGRLRGRVVDDRDRPQAGVRVAVVKAQAMGSYSRTDLEDGRLGSRAMTGPDGRFELVQLPTDVPLVAVAYTAERFACSEAMHAVEGESVPDALLRWTATGRVHGVVLTSDAIPALGAEVFLEPKDRSSLRPAAGRAGWDGAFEIQGVGPGDYGVSILHPGHRLLTLAVDSGPPLDAEAAVVAVRAGEATRVEAQLEGPEGEQQIRGHLVDAQGRPVPGFVLQRSEPGGEFPPLFESQTAMSDGEGAFAFENLTPGLYRIRSIPLQPKGLLEPREVFAGTLDLRLTVSLFESFLHLRVRDAATGEAISGADVVYWPTAGGSVRGTFTDQTGELRSPVPPGEYEVRVASRGHGAVFSRVQVPRRGPDRPQEIALAVTRRVRGRVIDSESRPVAGAEVVLAVPTAGPWLPLLNTSVAADEEGRFEFTALPDGPAHLGLLEAEHLLLDPDSIVEVVGAEAVTLRRSP